MFITILIFIIILGILVFVHEFGHFIVAKKSGMQVDEFGFGFPPRIVGIQKFDGKWRWVWWHRNPSATPTTTLADASTPPLKGGELRGTSPLSLRRGPAGGRGVVGDATVYSINAIPLGGFVKIRGENNESEDDPKSFINKGFWPRFLTLVAGVLMNVILAWVLISAGYMAGLPVAINSAADIPAHASFSQAQTAILDVSKNLPADKAGLKPNDIIVAVDGQKFAAIRDIQAYVKAHAGRAVNFEVLRGKQNLNIAVTPSANPPQGEGPTGIVLSIVGRLRYSPIFALIEGAKTTWAVLASIVVGLYILFSGRLGFSSLGGPVQIAKLTGQVAGMGFIYLMQFTAFLSLNLAVLNILPFPALDGGRVLFLFIEKLRGKRNNQKVEQVVNTAGFVFLLLLMVLVTIHDVVRK